MQEVVGGALNHRVDIDNARVQSISVQNVELCKNTAGLKISAVTGTDCEEITTRGLIWIRYSFPS
jgi:hypothetical protein